MTYTRIRPGEQVRMHMTSSGQWQEDGEEVRPQLTERGSGGGFVQSCRGFQGTGCLDPQQVSASLAVAYGPRGEAGGWAWGT